MPGRLAHGFGRLGPGLADFEMDHIGAGGLALIGGAQHIHGDEGRDQPPPRRTQTHPGTGLNSGIPYSRLDQCLVILREKVAFGERLWL